MEKIQQMSDKEALLIIYDRIDKGEIFKEYELSTDYRDHIDITKTYEDCDRTYELVLVFCLQYTEDSCDHCAKYDDCKDDEKDSSEHYCADIQLNDKYYLASSILTETCPNFYFDNENNDTDAFDNFIKDTVQLKKDKEEFEKYFYAVRNGEIK